MVTLPKLPNAPTPWPEAELPLDVPIQTLPPLPLGLLASRVTLPPAIRLLKTAPDDVDPLFVVISIVPPAWLSTPSDLIVNEPVLLLVVIAPPVVEIVILPPLRAIEPPALALKTAALVFTILIAALDGIFELDAVTEMIPPAPLPELALAAPMVMRFPDAEAELLVTEISPAEPLLAFAAMETAG